MGVLKPVGLWEKSSKHQKLDALKLPIFFSEAYFKRRFEVWSWNDTRTHIYIYILYVWMAGVREDVRVKMKIDLLMWFCAGFCEYL